VEGNRNALTILVGEKTPKEKDNLKNPSVNGRIITEMG
jgi:hypothetical protein